MEITITLSKLLENLIIYSQIIIKYYNMYYVLIYSKIVDKQL